MMIPVEISPRAVYRNVLKRETTVGVGSLHRPRIKLEFYPEKLRFLPRSLMGADQFRLVMGDHPGIGGCTSIRDNRVYQPFFARIS